MPISTSWNLEKYFYKNLQDPSLTKDIQALLPAVKEFRAKWGPKLATISSPEELALFFQDDEILTKKFNNPSLYLFYKESLDTQDGEIKKISGKLEAQYIQMANELVFIGQAWKIIGEQKLLEWSESKILAPYKNAVISQAESVKRILGEEVEQALNIKSRALSVPNNLYEELTNSYEFEIEIDGEIKHMTDAEIRSLRESSDREMRKKAFESIRKVYLKKDAQITLGSVYSAVVKDWSSKITLRKYSSVMEPRNISEELENEIVDMLMNEVQSAYPLYARYMKAKAKILGLSGDFHTYDSFAPLSNIETPCPLEEGLAMHLETMKEFDEEFYQYSKEMFEEGRVDAFSYKGKRGGAFASYTKDSPSFVLLNYTGKLLDVPTLSHELGHAIHGHLSQVQSDAVYSSPLSLAETASIFSEMLLAEKIKAKMSEEEKVSFLSNELQDAFSTIFRQIQYVSFERRVHEAIHQGDELTYREFNTMWREEQLKMTGDSLIYDSEKEEEPGWSTIPHIFNSPFYCYAYAFGQLLTYALYAQYQKEWASFVPKYKEILRSGGAKRPKDLLWEYGFDITKPEFFRLGLDIIKKKVEEFEKIAGI